MKTAIRDTPEFDQFIDIIKEMVSDLPDDRLKDNYSFENLIVDEWVAVSVFEGGFSSVAWRPWWGNNCRILNRFYKKPGFRFENNKRRVSQETLDMIEQQLRAAWLLEYDCAFMSRETKTQAFNHYKKHLQQPWYSSDKKYRMTENSYQNIMWTPLNSNELIMEK